MKNKTHWTDFQRRVLEAQRIVTTVDLKECDLCGAINARHNQECFVCGWNGHFSVNPDAVRMGVIRMLERSQEIDGPGLGSNELVVPRRAWIASLGESLRLFFRHAGKSDNYR